MPSIPTTLLCCVVTTAFGVGMTALAFAEHIQQKARTVTALEIQVSNLQTTNDELLAQRKDAAAEQSAILEKFQQPAKSFAYLNYSVKRLRYDNILGLVATVNVENPRGLKIDRIVWRASVRVCNPDTKLQVPCVTKVEEVNEPGNINPMFNTLYHDAVSASWRRNTVSQWKVEIVDVKWAGNS